MDSYQQWLLDNGYGAVQSADSAAGGCISDARRITLDTGERLFLKHLLHAPSDMFPAEAAGLQALAHPKVCRVPQVIHAGSDFILLEDLGCGSPSAGFWENLGRQLAHLHQETQPEFGFQLNNYCGATAQDNSPDTDGHRFFAERRLLALARQAFDKGLLSSREMGSVEHIAGKLNRWVPDMPAVLIHGDLWSGNIHCDHEGQPALIDPATYWGWAEAELAMTQLFGGFPQAFYASYEENSAVAKDWKERASLYNLYHLLNHLLLFGASYHASVMQVLNRYNGMS